MLTQPENRGKGAAVRTASTSSHGDIVLIQDADLEYDPDGHPGADRAARSRARRRGLRHPPARRPHPQRAHLFWHYAGNRFLSLLTNVLYNTTISDMEVGYKAFRATSSAPRRWSPTTSGSSPSSPPRSCAGPGIRLYEVPISYYGRTYAEGKKITWRDGFGAVGALLRFRFF